MMQPPPPSSSSKAEQPKSSFQQRGATHIYRLSTTKKHLKWTSLKTTNSTHIIVIQMRFCCSTLEGFFQISLLNFLIVDVVLVKLDQFGHIFLSSISMSENYSLASAHEANYWLYLLPPQYNLSQSSWRCDRFRLQPLRRCEFWSLVLALGGDSKRLESRRNFCCMIKKDPRYASVHRLLV